MEYKDIPMRQINMNLTDLAGCALNDIIWVPMSPILVEGIFVHYREEALKEGRSYSGQGFYRDIADHFERIHSEWKIRREEKEKR